MDISTLVMLALAVILSGLAYLKSPELPLAGLKMSGGRFVLLRLASGFFLPVLAGLIAQFLTRE